MTSTWMPRERWDALVRGEACPLYAEIASGEAENTHGFVVADLRISQLRLSREQDVPGWCVLTCRRHVREPHDLAPEEPVPAHYGKLAQLAESLTRREQK